MSAWDSPWIEPQQEPTVVERWSLADWIRGAGPDTAADRRLRPVNLLRQRFTLSRAPVRARLRITARGVYTARLNGVEVGDEVLAPGFDSYMSRLSVQTYDVLPQLVSGDNVLSVALADGWWAGRIGITGSSAQFGDRKSATWRLDVTYPDGRVHVVRSGDDVRCATGPWEYSDLFIGERFDAGAVRHDWDDAGGSDDGWEGVREVPGDAATLVPFRGEPIRRVMNLRARQVCEHDGAWIVDFGQVLAGRVRLTLRGRARGEVIVVEHTETLAADGSWYDNIQGINKDQTDVFISAGDPVETWEPTFTVHGFRYVRVRGVAKLHADDVVAVVISSDLDRTGRFETSDARLNRLHENAVWSQRANFLSIPTDCPQRERAGWTGDLQVFATAAANNARVYSFLARWLENLRADQRGDGRVTITSPYSPFDSEAAATGEGLGGIVAAAGWSDAVAIVPWTLYERSGDPRILEENYNAVRRWIDYQTRTAAEEMPRSLRDEQLTPERRARQALLYNTGEHFGDWLTPSTLEGRPVHEAIGTAPRLTSELVAPMFQIHTLDLAAQFARALERRDEAADFSRRAAAVRRAFGEEYVSGTGKLPVHLQGMYALALGLDVVDAALRNRLGDHLASLVRERGTRLDTGFLSTPHLLDALWDTGHRDLARALLWQDQVPSWLYAVDQGATSIWESWDVIAPDGTLRPLSMNHYAFGCVDDWLYRRIAGLTPMAPGWRRARVEPDLDAGLRHVDAAVDTPYGELRIVWRRETDVASVRVDVPHGIEAELVLPGGRSIVRGGRTERIVSVPALARV